MVDEIPADRIVPASLDRHFDLGSHAIRARDKNWLLEIRRNSEHSGEATEAAYDTFGECRFGELSDSFLRRVGSIDVDSSASVAKRVIAHAGSSSSNATSRRISRMR
jgi:hypothetical protein